MVMCMALCQNLSFIKKIIKIPVACLGNLCKIVLLGSYQFLKCELSYSFVLNKRFFNSVKMK